MTVSPSLKVTVPPLPAGVTCTFTTGEICGDCLTVCRCRHPGVGSFTICADAYHGGLAVNGERHGAAGAGGVDRRGQRGGRADLRAGGCGESGRGRNVSLRDSDRLTCEDRSTRFRCGRNFAVRL